MKKFLLLLFVTSFLMEFHYLHAQHITITADGKAKSIIIIPKRATAVEIKAAKVFQDYIQRISGAQLNIRSAEFKSDQAEILIGHIDRPELNEVPFEKLGKDGLFIKSKDKVLVITGGDGKGVLYAVYTFLEKYLGCKKYSSKVTFVPKNKSILLRNIEDLEIPAFTFREDFYPDAYDPEYMDWHKLSSSRGKPDQGNEWGLFVHTFDHLLSSKEYGNSHPEYFSFYDGIRHPGYSASGRVISQLCLTNPEVLEIVCKNLQTDIERNPAALYWSVSQNDNLNYCRDENCDALNKKYFSNLSGANTYSTHATRYTPVGMGALLPFVNKVAERFPDKMISTLAYQWSRKPPENLKPRENVNIMLCNIESPRHIPFKEGDGTFTNDLEEWTKLTHNIIVWDYVVQYRNLISPFPNLFTLQPNLQYLRNKGIKMIFEEGNPETGGEFSELKAYLIAKLLWNPDINFIETMDDFLKGFYGKAAPMIREYIDLLHESLKKSGVKLKIYDTPLDEKNTFLTDVLIKRYIQLFDKAEEVVRQSPELLDRVKTARLPISYAILEIARDEKVGKRGAFIVTANKKQEADPKIIKILYDFVYQCVRDNVTHISEGRTTPMQYLQLYVDFLNNLESVNLSK